MLCFPLECLLIQVATTPALKEPCDAEAKEVDAEKKSHYFQLHKCSFQAAAQPCNGMVAWICQSLFVTTP